MRTHPALADRTQPTPSAATVAIVTITTGTGITGPGVRTRALI